MSEEKKLILEMLRQGRISEEEAIKLLDSIKENGKKAYSKTDDELAKLLESLTRNGKVIGQKAYNYAKNIDYDNLKEKTRLVVDRIFKLIDDFKVTRL